MSDPSTSSVSRRNLLWGAALVPAALGVSAPASAAADDGVTAAGAATDFDTIRIQWRETLVASSINDPVVAKYVRDSAAVAANLWRTMNTSSSRSYLWADLDSSTIPAVQRNNIGRLRQLALALKTPGSTLSGDPGLTADLVSALDWFLANKYGVTNIYGGWWDWQIGIPLALNDFCVLMYDDLPADQIASAMAAIARYEPDPHVVGSGPATSANLNWTSAVTLLRGALSRDAATLSLAKSAWAGMFPYSTDGDGFYTDGGFIQHVHYSYNGSYGVSLLQYLTYGLVATRGTAWAFSSEAIDRVISWVQDNYRPWMYDGAFMDMTRGRALSRFYETDHRIGRLTTATLLQLAQALPAEAGRALRSQVKAYLTNDTFQPFFVYDPIPIEQVRIPSIVEARDVLADDSIPAAGDLVTTRVATSMARAVHRRPDFAYAIAMDRHAIYSFETANKENVQGWYTGEGAVYVYLPDQVGHWADMYWPTADKYRIPGITRDRRPLPHGVKRYTFNEWAGGAVLDDRAAVGMQLNPKGQTLRGSKSWFCMDDAVVCLGAGISSTDGYGVETVVENRNIGKSGTARLTVDGRAMNSGTDATATRLRVGWAHLDQVGGYVFPERTDVDILREDRSGRWTDMDLRGVYEDPTLYTRRFVTMWIDHGTDPADARYAYVQLPAASRTDTERFARRGVVEVLANTPAVQAATRRDLGLTMANVWAPGTPPVGGISVDRTASVVVSNWRGELSVAICDPTQLLTGNVTVEVAVPARQHVGGDAKVHAACHGKSVSLSVDMTDSAGRSYVARFRR
ncbi:polysaccharide lyase 8 family protein [Kribbella shirazensis]|uniref:Hyaluronate lyase n=1 Tax=Kribbella shirazensis TaxID=1105143 RepID=A0A7X5VBW0_9ACTN|nr:polysaccharide lyase 8 family protein [Kribbella shirazensis]NIK58360.1 hyaluronate lyase [Kribbella shirazensis]